MKPKLKAFVQEARISGNGLPQWVVQLGDAEFPSANGQGAFENRQWTVRQMMFACVEASTCVWKPAFDWMKQPGFSTQHVPSAHTDDVVFERLKFPLLRDSFVSPLSAVEKIHGVVRQWSTAEDSAFVVDHLWKRPQKLPAAFSGAEVNRLLSCAKCHRHRTFLQPGPNPPRAGRAQVWQLQMTGYCYRPPSALCRWSPGLETTLPRLSAMTSDG